MTEQQASPVMEQLTAEEMNELAKLLNSDSGPLKENHTVHSFLHKVATSDDTTKTGNVTQEELGMPKLPVRTHKELAVFCKEVADMDYFATFFDKMSEITTSTSLAKDGFLTKLAVVTRREMADVTKRPREKRGFFRKKEEPEGGAQ